MKTALAVLGIVLFCIVYIPGRAIEREAQASAARDARLQHVYVRQVMTDSRE